MSRKDFQLFIGATWFIDRVAVDRFGAPLDLTGGSVEFRMASASGLVISLASPADIDIATGTAGAYTVRLAATDSRQASIAPGLLDYEVDAITASGLVAVQNTGKVLLLKSLRALYPGGVIPDTTAPTVTSAATRTVAENASFSHTLTANESVTWSKTGGADAALFTLVGATLSMSAKNFEAPADANGDNAYVVQVTATDGAGNSTVQTITVTVTDVDEIAPTITSGSSFSVNESTTFSTTATASETVSWAKGGTDASLVTLNTSTGAWSVGPQIYATKPSVVFTLTATDLAGNVSAPQTVTLSINAVAASGQSFDFSDLTNSGLIAILEDI